MRIDQAAQAIESAYDLNEPSMLWGGPGVGKTAIHLQLAEKKKVPLIAEHLAEFESVDLRGTPRERNGFTYWAPQEEWPWEGSKKFPDEGIILLDELPQAKMDVKNVATRFVFEGIVGSHRLKKGWRRMSAGNRMGDAAGTSPMPTHLNNRFWHIEVTAAIEPWLNWADANNVDDRIIAYLKYKPMALHAFDPRSKEAAFASPRTWVMLSNKLKQLNSMSDSMDSALLGDYVSGYVGAAYGKEFTGFLRTLASLVSIEQILLDPAGAPAATEPSICYALATALAAQVSRSNIDAAFQYMGRLGKEFAFIFAKKIENLQPALRKTKAWVTFSALNADYI